MASVLIIISIITIVLVFILIHSYQKKYFIPNKLIYAIDQAIPDGGDCHLYLADVFSNFDWDTVTIFEPPYRKELNERLQIENREGQDGIVFSLNNHPIYIHYSSYQYNLHEPATISYTVNFRKTDANNNYVSLSKDFSYVKATKYRYHDVNGNYSWKYVVFLYD